MSNGEIRTLAAVEPAGLDACAQHDSVVARLKSSEAEARRIADLFAESFDTLEAVAAAYEDCAGSWSVAIHFRDPPNETAVRALVALVAGSAAGHALTFETTAPQDWVKASLEGLAPVAAGRFVVHGAHDRARVPTHRIGIEIEAAMAFGTGHHGTTRGCLIALDRLVKGGKRCRTVPLRASSQPPGDGLRKSTLPPARILDVGTGTGVLAIAAARALRQAVLASDIDPIAVATARANARCNRTHAFVTFVQAAGLGRACFRARGPFDLIFANILLGPLVKLAKPLAMLTRRGTRVVLSGLLPPQANAIIAAYHAQGLRLERRMLLDGWVTLVLRRP